MSSATETTMLALKAALDASSALPAVRRDPVLDAIFDELAQGGDTYSLALALRHGDDVDASRRFGAGPEAYELVRNAEVEWIVAGPEGATLNSVFDAGIEAIYAAIALDMTLGGVVVAAEIVEPPELGTDQAGAKPALTALLRVQLTYVSPRSY